MSWDVGELIGNIIGVVLDIDAPPTGAAWAVFVFLSTLFNHFNGVRWSHWRKLPMVNLYGLHFNMNVCLHFATAVVVLGMGIESVIYGSRIRPTIANMAFGQWLRAPPAGRLPAAKASGSSPSSTTETTEGSTAHPPENPGVPFQDASRLSPHVSQHDAPLIPNSSPKFGNRSRWFGV